MGYPELGESQAGIKTARRNQKKKKRQILTTSDIQMTLL